MWAVAVDVFDDEIARNPVLLQRHFQAFSKMVAIAHFSPAKVGSSSTKATVYILDKYSVDYLKKLAKNLKDYHYLSVVSVKEEEKVLSALCAVQDVCLTNSPTGGWGSGDSNSTGHGPDEGYPPHSHETNLPDTIARQVDHRVSEGNVTACPY